MGDSDVRPRNSQSRVGRPRAGRPRARSQRRTSGTAIVLVTTKLRHPVLRPGTVGRQRLMDLLPRVYVRIVGAGSARLKKEEP